MTKEGIFRFGSGFQLDALSRSLRRNEKNVTLNRHAFDVLLYLVQNPGRILSRDELLKNVWPDSFVDENSLAQSISSLRRALDEKPGDNNYIVTLPGRGYQFISPVTLVVPENLSVVAGNKIEHGNSPGQFVFQQQRTVETSIITQQKEEHQPIPRTRLLAGLIAVFLLSAAVAGIYGWRKIHLAPATFRSGEASRPHRRSIAVIGFRNLSGRPDEAWLSTAFAEMLSTEQVAGEKLRLVSWEDVARTKLELPLADADSLSHETLARLHKNLDSDLIVLGSYTALSEKQDTRIRLDVTLQDTSAGETVTDVAVVGSEADLFDMVSRAGSQLRAKLGIEAVSPVEEVNVRASLPSNPEATRLYSEGLGRLRVFDILAGRDLLQQSIHADPKFTLAHSALAEAWGLMGDSKKAQQEARKANDLSSSLSREERLLVEGRYRYIGHAYEKAIEVYHTLFALFPDNLEYGLRLAWAQTRGGKEHDALATVDLLRKLPPPASEDPRIELAEAWAWDYLNDFTRQQLPAASAVEKAKAQGSRFLLALARENQCWLYYHFGQPQVAVDACREATDIFAAAGDRQDQANVLRTWADAISQTDPPQSIRLYEQAESIFRQDGSDRGVADVLNNLGELYESLGDPASAEKMQRQAIPIYRLLDDKRDLASTLDSLTVDRRDRGDLKSATQLAEDAMKLDREVADTDLEASLVGNLAVIHHLRGDMAEATQGLEQSLAILQTVGDQHHAAGAMLSLGRVLLDQADFSGARKMYEQALASRTSAGGQVAISEVQLDLADLSLEEAHPPAEQEASIRKVLAVFQQQKARDNETRAWCVLSRVLLVEGKTADALQAMQHALPLAAESQNPEVRWRTAIAAASLDSDERNAAHSSSGKTARKELAAVIAKSRERGYLIVELDARLALAELEMKAGQTAEGRAHLAAIEADAKAKGYKLVARKAATARG
jgi:DNA-binding winged helix-turn-helix (wHTH) protein/tetratricopeptide (TPR) repeat protein/TolB-like protein